MDRLLNNTPDDPRLVSVQALIKLLEYRAAEQMETQGIEDRLIALVEKYGPDFQNLLIDQNLATPLFHDHVETKVFIGDEKHLCVMGSDDYPEENDESIEPLGHSS